MTLPSRRYVAKALGLTPEGLPLWAATCDSSIGLPRHVGRPVGLSGGLPVYAALPCPSEYDAVEETEARHLGVFVGVAAAGDPGGGLPVYAIAPCCEVTTCTCTALVDAGADLLLDWFHTGQVEGACAELYGVPYPVHALLSGAALAFVPSGTVTYTVPGGGTASWTGPYWDTGAVEVEFPVDSAESGVTFETCFSTAIETRWLRVWYWCDAGVPALIALMRETQAEAEADVPDACTIAAPAGEGGIPLCPVPLGISCCAPYTDTWGARYHNLTETWRVRAGAETPVTAQIRVHARGLDCPDLEPPVEGAAVAAADVTVTSSDGLTVLTGTTDAAGDAAFTVTEGSWTVRVDKDGCVGTAQVLVSGCGSAADRDVTVRVCCARARIKVVDDEGSGDTVPVVGAVVHFPAPFRDVTTDASGIAELALTGSAMDALPLAGSDCNVRRITLPEIRAENIGDPPRTYLYRCDQTVDVTCGVTDPTPTVVRLRKIPLGTTIDEACCGPDDCTATGPTGRALRYDQLDTRLQFRPRSKAGAVFFTVLLDDYTMSIVEAELPARHIWRGPCYNLPTPVVLPNACEVAPDEFDNETWRSVRAEVELCTGTVGVLRIHVYRALDCGTTAGSESECPGCGADMVYETPIDLGAAVGSQTERLCYGESISLNRTDMSHPFCDILTEFDATGISS